MNVSKKCQSTKDLTLSIVSHGQGALISRLLDDLERLQPVEFSFEVLITLNIPEDESHYAARSFPLHVVRNIAPKGFGANHNAAFSLTRTDFFIVVNPDIRAPELKLSELLKVLEDPSVGACAPLVLNIHGAIEDSARRFPTVVRLARRVILRDRRPDYQCSDRPVTVDWVAGMFVVFRRQALNMIGGFDARRFFMYFEDVDLCARLQQMGWKVCMQPATYVVHDAQRASHRDLKHLRWHLTSALRYLTGL